jgi:hypothetical protein
MFLLLDILDCTLTAATLRLHEIKNEDLTKTLHYFARAYALLG